MRVIIGLFAIFIAVQPASARLLVDVDADDFARADMRGVKVEWEQQVNNALKVSADLSYVDGTDNRPMEGYGMLQDINAMEFIWHQ